MDRGGDNREGTGGVVFVKSRFDPDTGQRKAVTIPESFGRYGTYGLWRPGAVCTVASNRGSGGQ